MAELVDPPEAPESGGGVKARDLLNHAIILQPTGYRIAHDPKKNEDFEIVDCRFWRLESTGVAEEGSTGISWWKAREQLREFVGQFVACRPKAQDDNSILLVALTGAPRELAAKVIASFTRQPIDEGTRDDESSGLSWDDDDSPF